MSSVLPSRPNNIHPRLSSAMIGSALLVASLLGIVSCRDAATYNVLRQSISPDQAHVALLVERYTKAALSHDEYFVLIRERPYTIGNLRVEAHREPILVATSASGITFEWATSKHVILHCDACGLEPVDIIDKSSQWHSVQISYEGFPDQAHP